MNAIKLRKLKIGKTMYFEGLEIRKLKSGLVFYSNLMAGGNRVRKLLGKESDGFNLSRARKSLGKLRVDILDPEFALVLKAPKNKVTTIAQGVSIYLENLEGSGGKNLKQKRQQFRDHLLPTFGKVQLPSLSTLKVETYKHSRKNDGATNGTINSELALLGHLYSQLIEWGYLKTRPFHIKKLPKSGCEKLVFSKSEASQLIDSAKGDIDPFTYIFILIGLSTGMRHSEILSLRFENVDFDSQRIYIPKAKAGARYQPFLKQLKQPLQIHHKMLGHSNDWVFPSKSKTGHRSYMKKQFVRALKLAKLDDKKFTPHCMRHTVITRMLEAGYSPAMVQKMSGHKTIQMVMHYAHISDQAIDQMVNSVDMW